MSGTLSVERLAELVNQVEANSSGVQVVANAMGNLALMRGGEFLGWIDFNDSAVHWVDYE